MKTHKYILPVLAISICTLAACNSAPTKQEIAIIHTTDIHGYIANTTTNEAKETIPGLRISKAGAMKEEYISKGNATFLVNNGDTFQGNVYGSYDFGDTIAKLMNEAKYDVSSIGNHDFDFGIDVLKKFASSCEFSHISSNFYSLETNKLVYEPYKIIENKGVKIAFIGATPTKTITTSTPTIFKDDKGNYLYEFKGANKAEDLYQSIQDNIDAVKGKVDYVFALGHIGNSLEDESSKTRSKDIISNTTGLDAFIDGHSHIENEKEFINDKAGKSVLLTQAGCYFNDIGLVTISKEGKLDSKLITEYTNTKETVKLIEDNYINIVDKALNSKMATLEKTLYTCDPNNLDKRYIRALEMNIGDYAADAYYNHFNNIMGINVDASIVNGGAIRDMISAGDVTVKSMMKVFPFTNMACLIKVKGQTLKDALEFGVQLSGVWDEKWGTPAEFGGFLQVGGIKFTADPNIPTPVKVDGNGNFIKIEGAYRVKDIMIYNKTTKAYEPIDLNKEYNLAGADYILKKGGNGYTMFQGCEVLVDYSGSDSTILSEYSASFKKGTDNYPLIKTANSLMKFENYLLDYENPYGSGRINILPKNK